MKDYMSSYNEQKENEIARQSAMLNQYFNSDEWQQQAQQINGLPVPKYVPDAEVENKQIEMYVQAKKLKEYFESGVWKEKQTETVLDMPMSSSDNSSPDIEEIEKEIRKLQEKLKSYKQKEETGNFNNEEQLQTSVGSASVNAYPNSGDEEWRQMEQIKELNMRIQEFKKPDTVQRKAIGKALDDINNYFKSEAWTMQQQPQSAEQKNESEVGEEHPLVELPEMFYSLERYN